VSWANWAGFGWGFGADCPALTTIPDKTLSDLGWQQLLEALARRCHTERGAADARELELCEELEVARVRLAQVSELRGLSDRSAPPPFGGIQDVRTAVARVDKGGDLEPFELIAVGESLAGCGKLMRHLVAHREAAPHAAELAATMTDLSGDIAGPILDSFDVDGGLVDHASPRLGSLRRKAASLQEQLVQRARKLLEDPAVAPELQDKFYTQRDDRYVVPVRSDAPSRMKGIVHGTSHSGATLFIEPEQFVELNNKLKIAKSDIADEELRILAELSSFVREDAQAIRATLAIATQIDVLDASARLAVALDAHEPAVEAGGALRLVRARHPLMVLTDRECVPNDIALAPGTTMVISGPNAGGKTVTLKTLGLAALMVRAGLHVAADQGSEVPWLRMVYTDIGDDQSLERDLSTFSAHILHLRDTLADADGDTLVLIDEVAVGTAPEQGAALARAVLEALADRGARAAVTTHYEPVKALATADERFVSASVGFDLDAMAPTFRLHIGSPGSSGALMVARRLGLSDAIVDRAEELLGGGRAGIDELLAAADTERRRLEDERAEIERIRGELEADRRAAADAKVTAQDRERKLREGAHGEAVQALRRARDELDKLRTGLRRKRSPAGAEPVGERIKELAREVAEHAPAEPPPSGEPPAADQLRPGVAVRVPSLRGRGTVIEMPSRGKVVVRLGTMRTTVAIDAVRLETAATPKKPAPRPAPAPSSSRRRGDAFVEEAHVDDKAPARTPDNTLDLRGERVDDALSRVDRFLDDAMLASRDIVFVIHGHGTGALRKAVRAQLDEHVVVDRWRTGKLEQGGDGITVAWLDVI